MNKNSLLPSIFGLKRKNLQSLLVKILKKEKDITSKLLYLYLWRLASKKASISKNKTRYINESSLLPSIFGLQRKNFLARIHKKKPFSSKFPKVISIFFLFHEQRELSFKDSNLPIYTYNKV